MFEIKQIYDNSWEVICNERSDHPWHKAGDIVINDEGCPLFYSSDQLVELSPEAMYEIYLEMCKLDMRVKV